MTDIKWAKRDDRWVAAHGKYRLEVRPPHNKSGLPIYHWSVRTPTKAGGSGGTSSLAASKKEAERELNRFKAWLRAHP